MSAARRATVMRTYGRVVLAVRWQIVTFGPFGAFGAFGGFFATAVPTPTSAARTTSPIRIRFIVRLLSASPESDPTGTEPHTPAYEMLTPDSVTPGRARP